MIHSGLVFGFVRRLATGAGVSGRGGSLVVDNRERGTGSDCIHNRRERRCLLSV